MSIDLQRISLGALIIALTLLVDDAMSTIDAMTMRLAAGDDKEHAATYAYKTLAFPMLTGSFVTMAGFVPIGFAKSSAGEYTFSIFAVVSIAVLASWLVAVIFIPLLGVALLTKPQSPEPSQPNVILRIFRRVLVAAMRLRWLTILDHARLFRRRDTGAAVGAAAVLPVIGPAGIAGRSAAAAGCVHLRQ